MSRRSPVTRSPPCSGPARPDATAARAGPGAAAGGQKIQAIKLHRELTNVDLKTAKNVIDSL